MTDQRMKHNARDMAADFWRRLVDPLEGPKLAAELREVYHGGEPPGKMKPRSTKRPAPASNRGGSGMAKDPFAAGLACRQNPVLRADAP